MSNLLLQLICYTIIKHRLYSVGGSDIYYGKNTNNESLSTELCKLDNYNKGFILQLKYKFLAGIILILEGISLSESK